MEDELTIEELMLITEAMKERDWEQFKRAAMLKGINLDENTEDSGSALDRAKIEAEAALAGKSVDEYEWDMIGIQIEKE